MQNHKSSSSSKKTVNPAVATSSSTAKVVKSTDSETGQTAPTTTISAADSLAQALGFETIPSHTESPPSTTEKTTMEGDTATTKTTDPLAEAFGFDTTPEDIENLIQLMAPPDSDLPGGVADSGYMTSNPLHTDDWANFSNS